MSAVVQPSQHYLFHHQLQFLLSKDRSPHSAPTLSVFSVLHTFPNIVAPFISSSSLFAFNYKFSGGGSGDDDDNATPNSPPCSFLLHRTFLLLRCSVTQNSSLRTDLTPLAMAGLLVPLPG